MLKRVTSSDSGTVEDPENTGGEENGGENTGDNGGNGGGGSNDDGDNTE